MTTILEFDVPYLARVKLPRKRDQEDVEYREVVPIAVRTIDDAPIAISMRGRTLPPHDCDWRVVDGRLYRPMFDGDDLPIRASEFHLAKEKAENRQARGSWIDYPLKGRTGRLITFLNAGIPPGATVFQSNREHAIAGAVREMMDAVLVIGGVVHMRAPAPVWCLNPRSNILSNAISSVELAMPDRDSPSFGYFRGDQSEAAVAFAESLLVSKDLPAHTFWPNTDVRLGEGRVIIHDENALDDPVAGSIHRAMVDIEYAIAPSELGKTPFELLVAFVELKRACQEVDSLSPTAEAVGRAGACFEAYRTAYAQFGDQDWPRGASSQEFAIVASERIARAQDLNLIADLASDPLATLSA
ncbi:hypothetical protein [Bosea sp. ANAM02]|uniref:hypothetical protein n=1 Tax=Bosea sp. ANAM02 TaxID=2020412 RepID=UPI00140EE55B|nr:hypothetical protein [Bosea sp. ANAM02]BCB22532.1 hypothetical protein OCUBac02_54260 [Bosea sp. ANAM02]